MVARQMDSARLTAMLLAGWLAACSSSGSWTPQDVPRLQGVGLYTLWVVDQNDVWLGGSSIWHFDGSSWSEKASPDFGTDQIIKFWGFSKSDIWAISGQRAFHWNGTSWSDQSPQDTSFNALSAIWGVSSDDLWIGNSNNSRLFHFNGTTWRRQVLQFVEAGAIWGSGPDDIWLAGWQTYHYDGTSWSRYDDGNEQPNRATSLCGFAKNDVWAAGGTAEILHFDGQNWNRYDEIDGTYHGIWGPSPDRLYAVGSHGHFARYQNGRWNEEQVLELGENFTMIHGSSASNVWAASIKLEGYTARVYRLQD
jgi:hypothetical protein